uniref:Tyrosine-protein kinase ephrin type A/B receptor-like domain-containing protein n=1 Tax=Tetradesmus obliquus TaxID=3088 RepID=A0A383W0D9_TETOB|eukprot:jgi/Sobl393_1/11941/SZX70116.1
MRGGVWYRFVARAAVFMLLSTVAAVAAAAAAAAAAATAGEPPALGINPTAPARPPRWPHHFSPTYSSNTARKDMRAGMLSGLSHQAAPPAHRSALRAHVYAPVAQPAHQHAATPHPAQANTPQPAQVPPGEQDQCMYIRDGCLGAGHYFYFDGGPSPSCGCFKCGKGTFRPGNGNWEGVPGPQPWTWGYQFGYYQCGDCCACNPDGYTTASTGSASGDACSVCLPGYGRHEQLGGVPPCVCLPCPSGTYSGKSVTGHVNIRENR